MQKPLAMFATCVAILGWNFPAAAQVGPPVQLVPVEEPAEPAGDLGAPAPLVPGQDLTPDGIADPNAPAPAFPEPVLPGPGFAAPEPLIPAPAPPPPPTPAPGVGVVVLGELADVDPSVVGLLDESQGGFGTAMWAGSNRARIERLLPRLPMGTLSPAMQDLARRLLLSTAEVPVGEAQAPSLLGLRVERLMAGGRVADVNELLRLAAASLDDPAFARAEVDGLLLAGNNAGACEKIANMVRGGATTYWIKNLAFCRALENDTASVELALALLRDQGEVGDEAFFTLIGALSDNAQVTVATLIDPAPLHIAMMRAAGKTVPPDAVAGAQPAILTAIAGIPNATIDTRLEAAERAEGAGAITATELARIYEAVPFTPVELRNAVQRAQGQSGPRVNALLFQVAKISTATIARAAALQSTWSLARESGGFGTAARVNLEATRTMKAAPEVVWVAGDAARALLAAGDPASAWDWLDLALTEAADGNEAASVVADGLWPLMQIADPEGAFMRDADRAQNWWQQLVGDSDPESLDQLALLFTLYGALGSPVPDAAWDPLFAQPLTVDGYMPSPAVRRALDESSEAGRKGETVLLALLALGDAGTEGTDPATLFDVITALLRVGLTQEARAIALEAALGRGL